MTHHGLGSANSLARNFARSLGDRLGLATILLVLVGAGLSVAVLTESSSAKATLSKSWEADVVVKKLPAPRYGHRVVRIIGRPAVVRSGRAQAARVRISLKRSGRITTFLYRNGNRKIALRPRVMHRGHKQLLVRGLRPGSYRIVVRGQFSQSRPVLATARINVPRPSAKPVAFPSAVISGPVGPIGPMGPSGVSVDPALLAGIEQARAALQAAQSASERSANEARAERAAAERAGELAGQRARDAEVAQAAAQQAQAISQEAVRQALAAQRATDAAQIAADHSQAAALRTLNEIQSANALALQRVQEAEAAKASAELARNAAEELTRAAQAAQAEAALSQRATAESQRATAESQRATEEALRAAQSAQGLAEEARNAAGQSLEGAQEILTSAAEVNRVGQQVIRETGAAHSDIQRLAQVVKADRLAAEKALQRVTNALNDFDATIEELEDEIARTRKKFIGIEASVGHSAEQAVQAMELKLKVTEATAAELRKQSVGSVELMAGEEPEERSNQAVAVPEVPAFDLAASRAEAAAMYDRWAQSRWQVITRPTLKDLIDQMTKLIEERESDLQKANGESSKHGRSNAVVALMQAPADETWTQERDRMNALTDRLRKNLRDLNSKWSTANPAFAAAFARAKEEN